jgi:trans-aconitate methyltransferase
MQHLRDLGCEVVGVDAGADMVRKACEQGLEARVMDGHALTFEREFDAVFSNAALHWMKRDPDAVIRGATRALKPGGRFVGEFGGHGNVAAIVVAILAVLQRRGIDGRKAHPWFFPTAEAYAARLAAAGLEVKESRLIPRPTPLPTGIAGWLETFSAPFLGRLPEGERQAARDEVVELLRPALCDERGNWTADYIRLRFKAVLPA